MPTFASNSSQPAAGSFVLIEDDALLCELLVGAIESRFSPRSLRSFTDGSVGLAHCLTSPPDLLVVDLRLPGVDGREIIRQVRARHPATRVVVITSAVTPTLPAELLALGVAGFIDKSSSSDHVERAIERVLAGGLFFLTSVSPSPTGDVPGKSNEPALGDLTAREREIVRRAAAGLISAEIAAELGLRTAEVETERGRLMNRIGARDLPALIRWYERQSPR